MGDQQQHASDHDCDPDVAQRHPAVDREEHRGPVQQDHRDEQIKAHHVDDPYRLLHRVELIRLEHDQLAGVFGDAVGETFGQAETVGHLHEQLAQVDHECPARRRQEVAVAAAGDGHERRVCPAVHVGPQRGEPLGAQCLVDQTNGVGLQGCCDRSGQLRGRAGQQRFDLTGDVDGAEQFGDEILREGGTHVVVGQHVIADRHPLIGVERLTVDPAVECGAHPDDRGEHDQQPDRPAGSDVSAHHRRVVCDLGHRGLQASSLALAAENSSSVSTPAALRSASLDSSASRSPPPAAGADATAGAGAGAGAGATCWLFMASMSACICASWAWDSNAACCAACCSAAACCLPAWRLADAPTTADAVPATTAVRAIVPTSPGRPMRRLMLLSPWIGIAGRGTSGGQSSRAASSSRSSSITSPGTRKLVASTPPESPIASRSGFAQVCSNTRIASELPGSRAAASSSTSSSEISDSSWSMTLASRSASELPPSSSNSVKVTSPSASFCTSRPSTMLIVSLSTSRSSSGMIPPLNWLPGKLTTSTSMGPRAMRASK